MVLHLWIEQTKTWKDRKSEGEQKYNFLINMWDEESMICTFTNAISMGNKVNWIKILNKMNQNGRWIIFSVHMNQNMIKISVLQIMDRKK